jgi:glycosyltransferase involved in cell wall biosynthesis
MNAKSITLVCAGFNSTNLKLQPWYRIYEIARRLVSKGVSVTIVTDGYGHSQCNEISGINIVRINSFALALIIHKKKTIKSILSTNPDIVVWYGTPFSVFYIMGLKGLCRPLVWDIETDVYDLKTLLRIPARLVLNPVNNLYTYFLTTLIFKNIIRAVGNSSFIKKIIVPSKNIQKRLTKKGINPDKITIVESTIYKEDINYHISKKDLRVELGLPINDLLITYFGAPHTLRGPDVAVESMQKIANKLSNVQLLILSRRVIGDINKSAVYHRMQEEYLAKKIAHLNLNQRIRIISGFMEKQLLYRYLQASDIVVFPFRIIPSEPPVSVFEAMLLGKAVVSSSVGCLSEIVGKNRGLLVEPGNSTQLANALLFLLEDEERIARFGENAQNFASLLPNWDNIACEFQAVLNNAL